MGILSEEGKYMTKQERSKRYQENNPLVHIDRVTYDKLVYYSRISDTKIKEIMKIAIKQYLDTNKSMYYGDEYFM